MFRNTLTANDKYPVRDCENLSSPIQMKFSSNPKPFLILLFHFCNLHQILNILEKKMIVIATFFRKLHTVKDLVRPLLKNSLSENPLTFNMLKGTKLLQNLHEGTFITFFHHSERNSFGKCLP